MGRRAVILYDVMGTLVSEPFFETVPQFFGMPLEELYRVKDRYSWVDFERGFIDEATHAERFFVDRREWDVDGLKAAMTAHYEWLDGMEALCRRLKDAGYAQHTLSNYPVWYRLIEDKLRVSRYVDWTFVSCHMGFRKPAREAYEFVVDTLDVAAEDCIFIDDRPDNVKGAEAIGMRGVLRVDTPTLIRDLVDLGVPEAAP